MTSMQAAVLAHAREMFPTPAGAYVLRHGRWFTEQPRPRGVRKRAAKACYNNAMHYVLDHPQDRYVEGFTATAVGGLLVFQHGWAADTSDRVIDPTLDRPQDCLYFGVSFDCKTYCKLSADAGYAASLFHDGAVPRPLAVC